MRTLEQLDVLVRQLQGLVAAPVVSALPGDPFNGQVVHYLADATNGVVWTFKYRTASSSSYKWEFAGGAPLTDRITTDETFTADGAFHDASTAGPSITLPLAGDYDYDTRASLYSTSAAVTGFDLGLSVAGAGPAAPDVARADSPAIASRAVAPSFLGHLTGRAANDVLKLQYAADNATAHARYRVLRVWPVRVG